MKANVYCLEPLETDQRQAVNDGIQSLTFNMGEPVSISQKLIRNVPLSSSGAVVFGRLGLSALNPLVEIHMFAIKNVDFGNEPALGKALFGYGLAVVDLAISKSLLRTTVSHELFHAIGINPPKENPTSIKHCYSDDCIMAPRVLVKERVEYVQHEISKGFIKDLLFGKETEHNMTNRMIVENFDFCPDCKGTLHDDGPMQLNKLRRDRLSESMPRSFNKK